MLEEERKYDVDPEFTLPDLSGTLPVGVRVVELPPVTLTATYFDTADLRLARAGISLRHRRGDKLPWTVKLPADTPGIRHEISRAGQPEALPADLAALVSAYSRGAKLDPAAVVRTVRRAYELRDGADRLLAELADDAVSVLDGERIRATFREIEVERKAGDRELLDQVESTLTRAGARAGGFTPKHVRALGSAAEEPPDLVPPGELPERPSAGAVLVAAIRRSVGRLLAYDPLVRLRVPVNGDDTAVPQMWVGCQQLRSDLRTFGPLVQAAWADPLRDELTWLAGVLGQARDVEVRRSRLAGTAATDPLSPPDRAAVDQTAPELNQTAPELAAGHDPELAARHEAALAAVDEALGSARYLALVEALVDAARQAQLTSRADAPADEVLPRLVAQPRHQLADGDAEVDGAVWLR